MLRLMFNNSMYVREHRAITIKIYSSLMNDKFNDDITKHRYPVTARVRSEHTGREVYFDYMDASIASSGVVTMRYCTSERDLKDIDLYVEYYD